MDKIFSVKMKHSHQDPDTGAFSKKTSAFLVGAINFGDAEKKTFEHAKINAEFKGDVEVTGIIPTKIVEVFRDFESSKFFYAKCRYYEESVNGKPMVRSHLFIVEAEDIKDAEQKLQDNIKASMIDYSAVRLEESQFVDIIEHKVVEKVDEKTEKHREWMSEGEE